MPQMLSDRIKQNPKLINADTAPLTPLLLPDQFPVLSNQRPTIDASLGVGMVGGMKAVILLLVVFCVGCGETKICKYCKESIKAEATICKHCHKWQPRLDKIPPPAKAYPAPSAPLPVVQPVSDTQ